MTKRIVLLCTLLSTIGYGQIGINPETGILDLRGPAGPAGAQGEPGAGITTINTLTGLTQTFAVGTSGSDFNIASAGTEHVFNCPTASASVRGCISTANWSTFNGKESVLTFSAPLSRSTNNISIAAATSSANGYLASADWVIFNAKYGSGDNVLFGTITLSGNLTRTGMSDGCATWSSGILGSTGSACGSGVGGGTPGGANGQIQFNDAGSFGGVATTGSGNVALAISPALVTPDLGTPSALDLTNAVGLPIATGIAGLGSGVAAWGATPSSANLATALTDETGTAGGFVRATTSSTVGQVLRVGSGPTIGFGAVDLADTDAVTGILPDANIPSAIARDSEVSGVYLPLAGGTLTGLLTTDNLGIEFDESDTNPTCSTGNYNIFADLSENKLKKCINGVASDLDTTGATSVSGNGIVSNVGGTLTGRTLTAGASITITEGAGATGNPTIAVAFASQSEAEAGTDNDEAVTSERVRQAFDAWNPVPSQSGKNGTLLGTNGTLASWMNKLILAPTGTQSIDAVGDSITTDSYTVPVSLDAAYTLTSTPTFTAGDNGQHVCVLNVGSFALTLQDESVLTGSTLEISGATTVAIDPNESVCFTYSTAVNKWLQHKTGSASGGSSDPDETRLVLKDEMFPNRSTQEDWGELGWNRFQTVGTCTLTGIDGTANHPGISRVTGSTTPDTSCFVTLTSASGIETLHNLGSGGSWTSWEAVYIIRPDISSVADSRYGVGFTSPPNAGTSEAIWLESASAGITCSTGSQTNGNWTLVTRAATVDHCVDMTVANTANTWYKIKLYSTTAGTINAQIASAGGAYGSVKTSSTTVPTAALAPAFWVASSVGGTTIKAGDFDWFKMVINGLTR